MTCPQCHNPAGNRELFKGVNSDHPYAPRLSIVACAACHLVFTDPAHVPVATDDLYYEGYYGEARSESLMNRLAIGVFQRERQSLSLTHEVRKVLDVGCGDGTYLRHLPQGLAAFGYEPSHAGQKSLTALGLRFFDLHRPQREDTGTFDLVTMWQSLEHVAEPERVLAQIRPLLAGDGVLLVSVPNFSSWQARIFGPLWFHLDPTRHLYHYSLPVLTALLERNGFRVLSTTTFSLEYGVFGWWQSLFNLLPFDFNMGFKILKGRKRYAKTPAVMLALLTYAILALPFAALGLLLTLLDGLCGRGGVLNIRLAKTMP